VTLRVPGVDHHRAVVVTGVRLVDRNERERRPVDLEVVRDRETVAGPSDSPYAERGRMLRASSIQRRASRVFQDRPEWRAAPTRRLGEGIGPGEVTVSPVKPRSIARAARRGWRGAVAHVGTEVEWLRTRHGTADLALFHEFAPPPAGGGHQFLRALTRELEGRGLVVEQQRISAGTPSCLFNSFNFDFARLRRFSGRGARLVHRVDGPIGVYRGFDDGTDGHIARINAELASATILQSRFSLEKHRELGIELRDPVVVPNAVDPSIFHPPERREPLQARKVRVVATSWSDNPRKGGDALAWLDRNLDPARYELTFAGRAPGRFEHVRVVGALDSRALADLLRTQDLYVAPSRDDPCSNALLEALACGLPAVYRESGGHPELVGEGGLPFAEDDDLGEVLERLVAELEARRAAISTRPIAWVADRYLDVLGLDDGT
jgi:glycosyltransferase involved in cell wall biosynthesis